MHRPPFLFKIHRFPTRQARTFVKRLQLLLCIAVLALAGCAAPPQRPQPTVADTVREAAQAHAAQGDYLAAAQLYLSASTTAPEAQQAGLRLEAGGLLAQGGLWEPLSRLLEDIDPARLDPAQQARYQLLQAELSLAQRDPERALEQLRAISSPETLPDYGQRYYELRADAYAMAGNAPEAARQLIWLDGVIRDQQRRLANQYRIWEQLSTLTTPTLRELQTSPPPDAFSGWIELVLISRATRGDQQRWSEALYDWRARYPDHAAEAALLPELFSQLSQAGARAAHIAVLLPLSGRAAESAAAIRDGLLAAYYWGDGSRPELHFYDTGEDHLRVWSLYQQAIQDGADFVIGPLLKEDVEQLARAGQLQVPVLALNQIETGTGIDQPLYQFGLAPEDEARQVAERLLADGRRQVIALIPDSAWGERVLAAFADHFGALGGTLLDTGRYAPNSVDFKGPIQDTLNLDDSRNRHRALERLLGQKLQYEARRRQDVEAFFLLAFPDQARLIRPQLRFHHAGGVPVFSTSHVFSANPNAALDRDMDGLVFCDMPWVLDAHGDWSAKRERLAALWPERSKRYQRLFALGFDAYEVLPWLDTLTLPGFGYFPGATGVLTLDSQNTLHRSLDWAQFRGGVPQQLQDEAQTTSMEGLDEAQATSMEGLDEAQPTSTEGLDEPQPTSTEGLDEPQEDGGPR